METPLNWISWIWDRVALLLSSEYKCTEMNESILNVFFSVSEYHYMKTLDPISRNSTNWSPRSALKTAENSMNWKPLSLNWIWTIWIDVFTVAITKSVTWATEPAATTFPATDHLSIVERKVLLHYSHKLRRSTIWAIRFVIICDKATGWLVMVHIGFGKCVTNSIRFPDYIHERLAKNKRTAALSKWIADNTADLKEIPRYLIPSYFDVLITGIHQVLLDQCINLMST